MFISMCQKSIQLKPKPPKYYNLTISQSGAGSLSHISGTTKRLEKTSLAITAYPDYGWTFKYWLVDSINIGSVNPYTISMNDNHDLIAIFEKNQSQNNDTILTINKNNFYITNDYDQDFLLETISNSTISEFEFNGTAIIFSVEGESGTKGFCNISFPLNLIAGNFILYKNDNLLIKNQDYIEISNSTHYIFKITYEHSKNVIKILPSNTIPEFSINLIIIILITSTSLIIFIKKKLIE